MQCWEVHCYFFFSLTSLQMLNYVSYPQGTSAARGGEGRSPVLLPHQHSSPGLLCSGSRLAEEQPSCFHSGIAPYRRAKACGPGCFIVTAQPLGTEPHWPFSHAFTSAEGEASSMRTLHCEDPRKGCQHPTREGCSQARSPVDLRREAGLTEQPCADQDKPPGFQQC